MQRCRLRRGVTRAKVRVCQEENMRRGRLALPLPCSCTVLSCLCSVMLYVVCCVYCVVVLCAAQWSALFRVLYYYVLWCVLSFCVGMLCVVCDTHARTLSCSVSPVLLKLQAPILAYVRLVGGCGYVFRKVEICHRSNRNNTAIRRFVNTTFWTFPLYIPAFEPFHVLTTEPTRLSSS